MSKDVLSMSSGLEHASYRSTLSFLLVIACRRAFGRRIALRHSISDAYYWEFDDDGAPASNEDGVRLETAVRELVEQDLPITSLMLSFKQARERFAAQGCDVMSDMFGLSWVDPVEVYECDGLLGHYYVPLFGSTGMVRHFKIFKFLSGFCMQFPTEEGGKIPAFIASETVSETFRDYQKWLQVLGVRYMNSLHRAINDGLSKQLVLVSEAFHARNIGNIAVSIAEHGAKVVTIAGPSSSGKTTFSERLKIQLIVCGKWPSTLPMDNYFIDRSDLKCGPDGKPDFEAPTALDIPLLKDHLSRLIKGEEVKTPTFDFVLGKKVPGKVIKLEENDVLIMEGIHGLNRDVVGEMFSDRLFSVFAAPMTGVCLDPHNRIGTGDNRLMRRIVRDWRTRGTSVSRTLSMWDKVVQGAAKYIFPYHKYADAIFNSSLPYEIPVLKGYLAPLLHSVPEDTPEFDEAMRLQGMLKFIPTMDDDDVPNNSVLREFIGGTCFEDVEK